MSTGGGMSVGGISAEVNLEAGNLDAQLNAIQGRLDKVAAAMQRWQREFERGKIDAQQLGAAIDPLIAEQDSLRAAYERTTQAMAANAVATKQVHTGMAAVSTGIAQVGAGGKNSAMGLLLLGQAIDDVQYGFRAIVNNIPGVVMGLGGSAGIAGAVAIAGVGINQLINHWDDLTAAFGEGTPHIRTAADEMAELAKNTERTVYQAEKLATLQRQQEGMKRVAVGRPPDEEETARNVQAIIDRAGGQKIKHLLMDQMMPMMSDEEKREIAKAGERPTVVPGEFGNVNPIEARTADVQRAIKTAEIQERHRKIAEERAQKAMFEATQEGPIGDVMRRSLAQLPGLAGLPEATAEARRQQDEGARVAAEQFEMREQMRKQAIAEEEERDRLREEEHKERLKHVGDAGRAEVEARHRSRVREAEEAFPGIGDVAETMTRTALAREIPMAEVQSRIAAMLEARGITGGKERAGVLAGELTREEDVRGIQRQAIQEGLRPSKSQVLDITDIAARIQSGVGGEETPKKQLEELKTIRQAVQDLKNKGGLTVSVKK